MVNEDLTKYYNNINNLNFSELWKGEYYEKFSSDLNTLMSKLNTIVDLINKYNQIMELKASYEQLIQELNLKYDALNSCDLLTDEGKKAYESISGEIRVLESNRENLRNTILGQLNQLTNTNCEIGEMMVLGTVNNMEANTVLTTGIRDTSGFKYMLNPDEVYDSFKKVKKIYQGGYIVDVLDGNTREEKQQLFEDAMNSVLEQYTGREATVNSVLVSTALFAEKGYKLRYTHEYSDRVSVPVNNNEQFVRGLDCCSYVSWAVNKGTPEPFEWGGVGKLHQITEEVSFENLLPGDILTHVESGHQNRGHVLLIIENCPSEQKLLIAEENEASFRMTEQTFAECQYCYKGGSLEKYYTGEKVHKRGEI
jgi:hypothetical protein